MDPRFWKWSGCYIFIYIFIKIQQNESKKKPKTASENAADKNRKKNSFRSQWNLIGMYMQFPSIELCIDKEYQILRLWILKMKTCKCKWTSTLLHYGSLSIQCNVRTTNDNSARRLVDIISKMFFTIKRSHSPVCCRGLLVGLTKHHSSIF